KGKILIVDDEESIRGVLKTVLEHGGHQVAEVDSAASLQRAFPGHAPDVVLLDVRLGDADGLDLLPQIKKNWAETEVIVLTAHGTMDMAVEAGKRGAYNFLSKPFENEKLLADVKCAVERREQKEENRALRRALGITSGGATPVFQSIAMQTVVRTVERVAP